MLVERQYRFANGEVKHYQSWSVETESEALDLFIKKIRQSVTDASKVGSLSKSFCNHQTLTRRLSPDLVEEWRIKV